MDLVSLKYAIIFLLQDPPKFTQILISGLKTNHLATLPETVFFSFRAIAFHLTWHVVKVHYDIC
jgi:hypothetical protein